MKLGMMITRPAYDCNIFLFAEACLVDVHVSKSRKSIFLKSVFHGTSEIRTIVPEYMVSLSVATLHFNGLLRLPNGVLTIQVCMPIRRNQRS